MSFTREQWARFFLASMGNASPSDNVVDFVVGWTCHETMTDNGARFNLLNTTWDMEVPGQSNFNSIGVKNYPTFQTGIDATIRTIRNGYYPIIAEQLTHNSYVLTDNLTPEILSELNTWCGKCGYGKGFLSLGANHLSDTFNYGDIPNMNTPQEPTDIQRKEGIDAWNAYYQSVGKTPPAIDTGIFKSWLADWCQHYRFYGSPITDELYSRVNWNGDTITVQIFTGARAEWNPKDNSILWIGATGILNR